MFNDGTSVFAHGESKTLPDELLILRFEPLNSVTEFFIKLLLTSIF